MTARLEATVHDASAELARVRMDVTIAETGVLEPSRAQLFFGVRGVAYVRASAILEAFMKAALGSVLVELDARKVSATALRPCLHAVAHHGRFEAFRDLRSMKKWDRRVELLSTIDNGGPATFGQSSFALDGRTLRAEHFHTLWSIFGFRGPCLPSVEAIHRLALHDMAEHRNAIAHGSSSPEVIGRTKPTSEVLRMLEHVENIVGHVQLAADEYLKHQHYRR
jgi:hypothetical protein